MTFSIAVSSPVPFNRSNRIEFCFFFVSVSVTVRKRQQRYGTEVGTPITETDMDEWKRIAGNQAIVRCPIGYESREIHTKQCYCTVITTFCCHCIPQPSEPSVSVLCFRRLQRGRSAICSRSPSTADSCVQRVRRLGSVPGRSAAQRCTDTTRRSTRLATADTDPGPRRLCSGDFRISDGQLHRLSLTTSSNIIRRIIMADASDWRLHTYK